MARAALCTLLLLAAGNHSPTAVPEPPEGRVIPPLADPAAVPGIARCTSDGACTVTDASGTRPGSAFTVR
jgi:hypothetical protein